MYVCIYVCMYVYMYVCMYICMYVCMYVCIYVCMYACMYVYMYVYIYICMYICIYVYMYVYMYVDVATVRAGPVQCQIYGRVGSLREEPELDWTGNRSGRVQGQGYQMANLGQFTSGSIRVDKRSWVGWFRASPPAQCFFHLQQT